MKYSIAVAGSDVAEGDMDPRVTEIAITVGKEIARRDYILLTGGCRGYPLAAARGAKSAGGMVVAFSPARDEREHVGEHNYPTKEFDFIVYGSGFEDKPSRNNNMIRHAHAVIGISGGVGTAHELLCSVHYPEKATCFMPVTGGAAEKSPEFIKSLKGSRKTSTLLVNDDPVKVLDMITEHLARTYELDL
jgi:uncharacterized protein (TIGR00725 family)